MLLLDEQNRGSSILSFLVLRTSITRADIAKLKSQNQKSNNFKNIAHQKQPKKSAV